jgi:8-oxo-dGTP diphosphatase
MGDAGDGDGVIRVAAGIIVRDGRILIAQRKDGGRHAGRWEFPGGKIEPGERPEDALVREIREELGVEIRVGKLRAMLSHFYEKEGVRVEIHVFMAEIRSGEPENLDVRDSRWVLPAELGGYDFVEADRPLVSELVRRE